jgi:hypothetical protein
LDFGSGNGAFLLYFKKKYNLKNNYSLEISQPLINFQKKIIKDTFFLKTMYNIIPTKVVVINKIHIQCCCFIFYLIK